MWTAGLEGTYIKAGDTFTELKGVLFYSFGNYKIVPRKKMIFLVTSVIMKIQS
jgi:predicted extracellular nuclease